MEGGRFARIQFFVWGPAMAVRRSAPKSIAGLLGEGEDFRFEILEGEGRAVAVSGEDISAGASTLRLWYGWLVVVWWVVWERGGLGGVKIGAGTPRVRLGAGRRGVPGFLWENQGREFPSSWYLRIFL